MAVTQIDLDEDALAEVMRIAGQRTKKGAVNWALHEMVARDRRRHSLDYYAELAKDWDYEGWREDRQRDKRGRDEAAGA